MSVILQISDTHFGTEHPLVVAALVELAQRAAPDMIVLSGDLTQRARHNEFVALGKFLSRLPAVPLVAVPGNHDIPLFDVLTRITCPFRAFAACFGHGADTACHLHDAFVMGVNSVRPWRHKGGRLSKEQVEAAAARLHRVGPDCLRIVVVHHPLDVSDAGDRGDIVSGAAYATAVWGAAGADLVLSGHVHVPHCRPLAVRYGAAAQGCWTAVAGTAVSWRTRGGCPNSVNIVRVVRTAGRVRSSVEQWDFAAAAGVFVLAASHDLQAAPPGAWS